MADGEKNNIDWTDDGKILVLALYKKSYLIYLNDKNLGKEVQNIKSNDKVWDEYNFLIKKIPDKNGKYINKDANNRKGIQAQYKKFIHLNKDDGRTGFKSATSIDLEVWNKFKDEFVGEKINKKGELEKEEKRILALIDSVVDSGVKIENPIEYDVEGYVIEGKEIISKHKSYERNPTIVKLKKNTAKTLACEVCGFLFKDFYGEEFIECHHKNPVAQKGKSSETALDDLALVCSNCHRMIHRSKGDCLTIEQLKESIAESKFK